MVKTNNQKSHSLQGGFSLLELCIVIFISSLIMLAFVSSYTQYITYQRIQTTEDNMTAMRSAIADYFFAVGGRYPCPANAGIAPSDPQYLKAACDLSGLESEDSDGNGIIVNCRSGGGFCIIPSNKDLDSDGHNDIVLMGAVPIETIREVTGKSISRMEGLDGWGRLFTYAVTANLSEQVLPCSPQGTDPATLPPGASICPPSGAGYGIITARDETGQDTAGIHDDADYVLISHGADGNGAFTSSGVPYEPCNTPTRPGFGPGNIYNENCNTTDTVFIQTPGDMRDNGNFYDDRTQFQKSSEGALWGRLPDAGGVRSDIANINNGNVGIGTNTPTQKLEIAPNNGGIWAENTIIVNRICDNSDPPQCINTEQLLGVGISCPREDTALTAIRLQAGANGQYGQLSLDCAVPQFRVNLAGRGVQDCPPNHWLRGIWSDGQIICSPVGGAPP